MDIDLILGIGLAIGFAVILSKLYGFSYYAFISFLNIMIAFMVWVELFPISILILGLIIQIFFTIIILRKEVY